MHLIVGLGNPGKAYADNRHNLGARVVEALAKEAGVIFQKDSSKENFVTRVRFFGKTVILARPLVFMNLSGQAVRSITSKKRIPPENLLVVYDDVDLNLGTLRLRPKGSSGGHKGLRSVIENLGTHEFTRLKIGIGKPVHCDLSDYVLSRFSPDEEKRLKPILENAADCCLAWLKDGTEKAMAQFNKKQRQKREV
ncbi:MAG: aminoacyl-tRNA hydrolase [Candidatus Omnitrophota bacterium]